MQPLVVLVLMLSASFLIALAAGALYYLSRPRVETCLQPFANGKRTLMTQRVEPILANEEILVATVRLVDKIGALCYAGVLIQVVSLYASDTSTWVAQWPLLLLGAAVFVMAGELVPRGLGRAFSAELIVRYWWIFRLLLLFGFVGRFSEAIGRLSDRIAGRQPETAEANIEDELMDAVAMGREQGILDSEDHEIIQSVFDLREKTAAEIMTPRTDMFGLDADTLVVDAMEELLKAGFSRVPVYGENRDDIVGLFYVKDLTLRWNDQRSKSLTVEEVMRPKVHFVPESFKADGLLEELRKAKMHLAIVLDEYGGTAGVVTVEDIVEEIVGEITDEYDQPEEEPIVHCDENTVRVDAQVNIRDLNDAFKVDLPEEEDFSTIGGFVIAQMGRIPKSGACMRYNGLELEVLEADPRRILRLELRKKTEEKESVPEEE